ncbi:MAG: pyruvate kinase [Fimbriimonadales bacterium]|nr:pyruvate kinase [Fimbriimonadales bacterium]
MRRTKIVCTLGPAVDSPEGIRGLIEAGMNVARLNCSHGDWESKRRWISWIREQSPSIGPVAVLADLQGPKFRIGDLPTGARQFASGESVLVGPSQAADLPVLQPEVLAALEAGSVLLLGDGQVELRLTERHGADWLAKVLCGGQVRSRQGVTVVGRSFSSEALSPKDLEDLREAVRADVDYVALSYVRRADDVRRLRGLLQGDGEGIGVIAKIETPEAVENLEEIVDASDGIMIARGDLGLQVPLETVPHLQRRAIRCALRKAKVVITATQMLESMVSAGRPTRAEATDVANAVLDGTDALMLSGETATGKFPVESVRWMARIAEEAERHYDHEARLREVSHSEQVVHTLAVAYGAAQLAALLQPKAILISTSSGQTARLVSSFRPKAPLWCGAWNPKVVRRLAMVWGAIALPQQRETDTDRVIESLIGSFRDQGMLQAGQTVVVTAGVPPGVPGRTNLILTRTVE